MMKSGEEPAVKLEFLGGRWRKLRKRDGNITPVATFFRPNKSTVLAAAAIAAPHSTCTEQQQRQNFRDTPCVSVRKLAASFWELDNYNLPLAKMQNGDVNDPSPRLHNLHNRLDGGFNPYQLPARPSNIRRQLSTSLTQHQPQVERRNCAFEPVSPASYGSSMEITPYNPSSSVELEGTRDSNNLKTSTELLKVLNHIWRLEEQHVCNMSLIRLLKRDLHHAHSLIKELKQEQQANHNESDELVTQIKQKKLLRKQKDHVRIDTTINSLRAELLEERKLRKRSESMHKKLAKEVHDLKTTLTGSSKELENERESHNLLEDLCDEFALGIKEYEKELQRKRLMPEKNWDKNKLILHISESWLDERMDRKLKTGDTKSVLDKLRSEIVDFLESKRDSTLHRRSLESLPLNMEICAPRDNEDDDDSAANDSNCFELTKMNKSDINFQDETLKEKQVKKKLEYPENATGKKSSLQVRFEEQMSRAGINHVEVKEELTTGNLLEQSEAVKEGSTDMNQNYMIENLIRHHYLLSDNGEKRSNKDYEAVSFSWWNQQSPVHQWTTKLPRHDFEISESSSKLPQELKHNTLKEKLLEERTRGQKSNSCRKATISSSWNK